MERRVELLSGLGGFAELPMAVKHRIAERLQEERFEAGNEVVVERQMGDRMYVVVEGIAEVSTAGVSGVVVLGQVLAGEMFGEVALVSKLRRRKATVTALTPLLTLSLSSAAFDAAMENHPEVRADFIRSAEAKVQQKLTKVARGG